MTVVENAALIPYKAFTTGEGKPPAFVVRAHDEATVFPYSELVGVGWLRGEKSDMLFIDHRFFRIYLHGRNLEPLLESFESLAVRTIHVFDVARHIAADKDAMVITHIDDHYEDESGKKLSFPGKR